MEVSTRILWERLAPLHPSILSTGILEYHFGHMICAGHFMFRWIKWDKAALVDDYHEHTYNPNLINFFVTDN